jgi:N6-adenosine-specific RNA methylase IME4
MNEHEQLVLRGATETALALPADLSFEEWEAVGRDLGRIDSARQWWIGDWLNFGERVYGESYAQGMESTGLEYNTLAHYAHVANRVWIRSQTLSWNHHREIAKLESEAQEVWLVWAEVKEWTVRELRKAIREFYAAEPPELPEGEFAILLADPPWRYEAPGGDTPDEREVERHYNTQEVEDIAALNVPAAQNAVLFLWATNPLLREALEVMEAWGFEYRTNMAWVKDRIGMGYYVRGQHELLLIGRRGAMSPPPEEMRPPSVVDARRTAHSAKPEAVYEAIEAMYPITNAPRHLELYARSAREGWISWGNQL